MRRTKRVGLYIAISLLLTISIYLLSANNTSASEVTRPDEYYFIFNSKKTEAGKEYEMRSQNLLLEVSSGNWEPETDVQWISSEPGVVSLEPTSYGSRFVKLVRNGPGYSTITAVIKDGTNTYSLSSSVKVNLEYDYQKTGMTMATTTKERILVIDDIDSEPKQVYLKYVDYTPEGESESVTGSAISATAVTWDSDNESVAIVDEEGRVKAVGSGSAKITVTSNTMSNQDKTLSVSMNLIVAPKFSISFDNASGNHILGNSGNDNKNFKPVEGVPPYFVVESNATYGTNLVWEIIDVSTGKKLYPNNDKLDYTISANSGNVTFNNVKAGTYEIYAFANDKYNVNTNAPYAYMKIIVPIFLGDINIVMNVKDTYNIVENSNITSFGIFDFVHTTPPGGSNIARVNGTNGVITARKKGNTTILLKYKSTSKLYEDSFEIEDIYINVTVIDGISISATDAMLYTSGTLMLYAQSTDPDEPIIWTSDAPSIATVDKGLVTALKPGVAIITAQQKINGVIKSVTCEITVQQSVSTITLDPSEVNLAIGEYKTINASITPKSLSGVNLKWKTSNDKVVKIVEENPLTLTVQGVSGGNAVISAINEDNIVVGYTHVTVRQPVTSITLSDSKVVINLDAKSLQLRAMVYPENALNKDVNWTSSDIQIAKVSENGLVTFTKPGEVTIIARSVDNPDVMALCNITIEIPVASVALDDKEITMYVGQTKRLTYSVLPINASKSAVTWSSTKPSVASVDAAGRVTARQVGSTVIMLKSLDGGFTAYCTINIRQIAEGIKFSNTELELVTGQVHEMEYSLVPTDATDKELIWESSDTRIVEVDDAGNVTAKAPGVAFVIARTEAGGMSYVNITVKQPVTGLLLNFSEKTIFVKESFDLKVSISPSGASNLEVEWKSSNTGIATVSNTGEVVGIAAGTAIITCTTKDGGYKVSCVVTVRERLTSMELDYDEYRLSVKKSVTLSVIANGEIVTDQEFRWVSSNSDIASVNKKGKVTGHKVGFATITAYATDGSGADASCDIEVVQPVTRLTLNKSYINIYVGDTARLIAKTEPSKATYKTPYWFIEGDDGVVIIDEDGYITGLKEGSVTIKALAQDDSGKIAVSHVTVNKRVAATSVVLSDSKIVMVKGEKRTVRPVLNPINSTDGLSWSTDNSGVASVNSKGQITAKATGTAYITAMTDSGKTANIEVSVIGLNVTKLELEQYSRYTLRIEGATSRVSWDSSNPEIAQVNNGMVITKAKGTATITATVNGRKLTCKIKVVKIS